MLMDPGINGRETYERMIEIHPGQKAIIASGFSESDEVTAALAMGAGGFIQKPYSIDQLGQMVNAALNK
jgi:DNA-binding NarL/FixJ family response regulator